MPNEVISNLFTDYIIWNGVTEEVIVSAGETLAAGDIVARVTATGKIVKYVSETADDGSGVPYGIIDHAVDASLGDVATYIHISGTVDENRLDNTVALSDVIGAVDPGTGDATNIIQITVRTWLRMLGFVLVNSGNYDTY